MLDGRKITKIAREAEKLAVMELKKDGIGTAEFDLLHFIRHNPGSTQKDARDKLSMEKGAAARRCESLEAKGYIKRAENPEDKRSQLLYATEEADKLRNSKADVEKVFYSYLFEDIAPEKLEAFAEVQEEVYLKSKQESRMGFVNVRKSLHA